MMSAGTVLVLQAGLPPEVASDLRSFGHDVLACDTAGEAIELACGQHVDALIAPAESLSALLDAQGSPDGIDALPPLLTIGVACSTGLQEELRADGAEVVLWPEGRPYLDTRLRSVVRRRQNEHDVLLRRHHARTLQELAVILASTTEFEGLLIDALARLVESVCSRSAMVLVRGDDESFFYLMGASDDPSAVRLPVTAAAHPEVTEALLTREELWVGARIDGEQSEACLQAMRQRALATLGVFPLIWEGTAYGCLELCFDDEAVLPEATLDFLREATALVAYALRSSTMYQGLREQTHKTSLLAQEVRRQLEVLQKYREFFERAYDGVFVLDRKYRMLHINPAGEQITGYSGRGLVGSSLTEIVSEPDRHHLTEALEEMGKTGNVQSFDLSLMTTSGDPILVSVSPSAVLGDDELIVLSFRDVTEARALENELRSTKEFLERLIDSTVDAIVATDIDGKVVLFNQGAERIFGRTAEEVVNKLEMKHLYPEGMAEQVMNHLRSPDDGGIGRLEAVRKEVQSANGELVPVLLSANLVYEDGVEVGTVGIYSDLRDRLRIERTLAQAQEKLIETEKQALIAELAGTTAHELNQPLTSIMGYAELLKRRIPKDDSNHRAVETMLCEAERMAEIVRKIGKITRYETKAYVGETQILDLEKSSV